MAEYEVVREILNECANNQMRDVFFREIETDDPVGYVRSLLGEERAMELTVEELAGGALRIHADCSGIHQRFSFTPI